MPKIERALISVSDKKGILELARALSALRIEILSTGGTARLLKENKIPVIEVGEYTGQPEILDGRLKTLHPKIHGGILAIRSNPKHQKELKQSKIGTIDLLVVNLYPFEQTVAKESVSLEEAIENIDIGGPTMIRAAAKNWQDVTVIVDPDDYETVLQEMQKGKGVVSPETNFRLAQKVFILTARYDRAIASYLTRDREKTFPDRFHYQGIKVQDLRYGENPHQKAVFYRDENPGACSITEAKQLHGKELSFNNILDLDAAINLTGEFAGPSCVIIKHTNPCGVAALTPSPVPPPSGLPSPARGEGETVKDLFIAARECDPLSAFGGIIGINRRVDSELASEIARDFYECVVASEFAPEAFKILAAKKNIRLMEIPPGPPLIKGGGGDLDFKKVAGGLLVQERDVLEEDIRESNVVTKRPPTEKEWQALEFAWKVVKHVKSNAIVFAGREGPILRTVGIGCGQMSRIDSVKLGIMKGVGARSTRPGGKTSPLQGVVMASDAFFPFKDNVDEAAKAGVGAIIQPGGSLKDQESVDAANEHGMAMVFTGVRHFRH